MEKGESAGQCESCKKYCDVTVECKRCHRRVCASCLRLTSKGEGCTHCAEGK